MEYCFKIFKKWIAYFLDSFRCIAKLSGLQRIPVSSGFTDPSSPQQSDT